MATRILLTGSNGLLGQKIVSQLLERKNLEFLATARNQNRHPQRGQFAFLSLDITDPIQIESALNDFEPEVVINTAAQTQVDFCEDNREECDLVNITAVEHLAKACQKHSVKLVHISTDFVFDGAAGPYREGAEPNPVNYYGQSKLLGEQALVGSGADYVILRTILLYGITSSMSRSNIVLWAKGALEQGKVIKAVNDQWRCPTLAEDLAYASIEAAIRPVSGLYHISGPDLYRIDALVREVAAFWQLDASLIGETDSLSLNQRAKRPGKTGFIIDKARQDLDYQPRNLHAGLTLLSQQMEALAL
ncbi:MAG: SDR family oxidoreductase [Bacteroidota bacterium]